GGGAIVSTNQPANRRFSRDRGVGFAFGVRRFLRRGGGRCLAAVTRNAGAGFAAGDCPISGGADGTPVRRRGSNYDPPGPTGRCAGSQSVFLASVAAGYPLSLFQFDAGV